MVLHNTALLPLNGVKAFALVFSFVSDHIWEVCQTNPQDSKIDREMCKSCINDTPGCFFVKKPEVMTSIDKQVSAILTDSRVAATH